MPPSTTVVTEGSWGDEGPWKLSSGQASGEPASVQVGVGDRAAGQGVAEGCPGRDIKIGSAIWEQWNYVPLSQPGSDKRG